MVHDPFPSLKSLGGTQPVLRYLEPVPAIIAVSNSCWHGLSCRCTGRRTTLRTTRCWWCIWRRRCSRTRPGQPPRPRRFLGTWRRPSAGVSLMIPPALSSSWLSWTPAARPPSRCGGTNLCVPSLSDNLFEATLPGGSCAGVTVLHAARRYSRCDIMFG